MAKNLIIVESPAKAKTISKFLGNDYTVLASMGHVRDLPHSKLGFDPENNFEATYEVSKDKKKVIQQLKKEINKETRIYLATDEDREGESISWHLVEALGLKKNPIERIVFHEITKGAILHALQTPRQINQELVDAQQARRILDRAVGYELSPLLWKKIKYGLSAGRVQSVAVRILVEREREIRAFKPEEYWRIKALMENPFFETKLTKQNGKAAKVPNEESARAIESSLKGAPLTVASVDEREGKRNPVAPFTTSTLQQEASIKLGFPVKMTMSVAQQLYEGNFEIPGYSGGLITYMRTDSVNLSDQALSQAKEVIDQEFGSEYSLAKPRKFSNKTKGAQEAHEAIRPVDLSQKPSAVKPYLKPEQFKLYDLIWKRTLATQMKEALFAHTTIKVEAGTEKELLLEAKGQRLLFAGFLKAYTEGNEDPEAFLEDKDVLLPEVKAGQVLSLNKINSEQLFTKPPPRYSEAALVKKLESEGIGRPSTYAPTISTVQDRGYVEKGDDKRLRPTDMGEVVTDFLTEHFSDVVDLGFTAKIEEDFDEIAKGNQNWVEMLGKFYHPFHETVGIKDESVSRADVLHERVLGEDPKTGKPVSARIGRFGPMVQIGTKDDEEKPQFASIPKDKNLHDITLEEALKCFDLPRTLGQNDEGEDIIVNRGRFGPYVKLGKDFFSIKEIDPMEITLDEALVIIKEGKEQKAKNLLHDFGEIRVLKGPYGFYIKQGKRNYKIPKDTDPKTLDQKACEEIIASAPPPKARRRGKS